MIPSSCDGNKKNTILNLYSLISKHSKFESKTFNGRPFSARSKIRNQLVVLLTLIYFYTGVRETARRDTTRLDCFAGLWELRLQFEKNRCKSEFECFSYYR